MYLACRRRLVSTQNGLLKTANGRSLQIPVYSVWSLSLNQTTCLKRPGYCFGDVACDAGKTGKELSFEIHLRNLASAPVDGFDIVYSVDNAAQNLINVDLDSHLSYGEMTTVPLSFDSDTLAPDVAHTLTITAICEGDDVIGNNEKTIPIGTYTQSVGRRALIEEFTTEQCSNCPRAINTI